MDHEKRFRLGNTVFSIQSTMEIAWAMGLQQFETRENVDIMIHVRYALPGEPTPCCDGYANVEGHSTVFNIALCEEKLPRPDVRQILLMVPLSSLLLERGTLTLHASYICHMGQGIAFSGPSGVGKSTQAQLWQSYRNAKIVNGDRALITPCPDGVSISSHYLSGTSGICENLSSPLRAIVLLEQAAENKRLPSTSVMLFRDLLAQVDYKTDDRGQVIAVTALLEQLMSNVEVLRYGCRMDEDAVACLEGILFRDQGKTACP